jgi:hypothetical protein
VLPLILTVRFAVELCLLAAAAVVAAHAVTGTPAKVLLGAGALVIVGIAWGLYLSPKARVRLPLATRVALEVLLFALVSAGLWWAGFEASAVALFATDLVVLIGLFALGERPGSHYGPGVTSNS